MYYSNGCIDVQRYFPDVRSNTFVQVCVNYLVVEIIGPAHVEVILFRGAESKIIEKKGKRQYLVGIPNGMSLLDTELFYWFAAMCIVRYEVQECMLANELFGENPLEDIKAFEPVFSVIGNAIISNQVVVKEDVEQLLFLACTKKGAKIKVSMVCR